MSAIDLDLVELRCKLRGWSCERLRQGRPIERVDVHRPQKTYRLYRDGRLTPGLGLVTSLTRPRLTLADIVSSPPEGWEARVVSDDLARFDHADATVWFGSPTEALIDDNRSEDLQRMAAAARAVAELLVMLGEVE